MVTFSDMTTLLLTFFVLLLSMSSLKNAKIKQLLSSFNRYEFSIVQFDQKAESSPSGQSFKPIPELILDPPRFLGTGKGGGPLGESMQDLIDAAGLEEQVEIKRESKLLKITITDQVLFRSGRAKLRVENQRLLKELGSVIKATPVPIRIEGHTDDIPISTERYPSNWELSADRALAVLHFFQSEVGISPERISAVGYGEFKPVADNATEKGRALNRRVEIRLIGAFD